MAAIEVNGLTYTYPGTSTPALQEISFDVKTGELVAVLGANGAGKSTLLLALAGLIPALFHGWMEGAVRSAGMDTRQHNPGQFAGQAGLVLQNPANQLSNMRDTVYEEVAFGLENLGVPRAEMPDRIRHALEQVGLNNLEGRSPFTLSGGQQQRLALASVLALQPPILLLDEPTAMLDPHGGKMVFEVVSRLARQGATVLVASHSLEWIAAEATRVLVLSEGRLVLDGSPESVLVNPLLEEAGVGRLRYTQAAVSARQIGLWPAGKSLPASLETAAEGFRQTLSKLGKMGDGLAHSN